MDLRKEGKHRGAADGVFTVADFSLISRSEAQRNPSIDARLFEGAHANIPKPRAFHLVRQLVHAPSSRVYRRSLGPDLVFLDSNASEQVLGWADRHPSKMEEISPGCGPTRGSGKLGDGDWDRRGQEAAEQAEQ